MLVFLYLGHICSELRLLDGLFLAMSIKCPYLSFLIGFRLKSILFNVGIGTPVCFLGSFD